VLSLISGWRVRAMSENLDLVRSIYAAWERGDFSSATWADPQIEYIRADGPEPGTWTGLTRLAEAARTYLDAWRDFRFVADEYRELDDRRVLVLYHFLGHGKTSGVELDKVRTKAAHLFHVDEGRVVKLVIYLDRQRALADLGLTPEGDAA
jgi:ketosteroid isomerase-like protein